MDWTREPDLELLAEAMQTARTVRERERYEKMAYKMIHASAPIKSLREDLVQAVKHGDVPRIKRIQHHINVIRHQETNGQSFGNVKGEGIDKRE
jgi:hypothetical protein